jgi:hypothetical protein
VDNGDGLWERIVRENYLRNKTVANIKARFNDSPFWKGLLKVKDIYMVGRRVKIKRGNLMRFWKHVWLGETSLEHQFPILFDICQEPEVTFQECIAKNFVISFRRRLHTGILEQWNYIQSKALEVNMDEADDTISWSLNKSGLFTTKSVYKYLESGVCGPNYKWIWKSALPLKIKIFLWQMMQNVVLTRDNLKKRNWGGNPTFSFCNQLEDRNHLFYSCSSARVMWGALGFVLGTNRCPSSFGQSWAWFYAF